MSVQPSSAIFEQPAEARASGDGFDESAYVASDDGRGDDALGESGGDTLGGRSAAFGNPPGGGVFRGDGAATVLKGRGAKPVDARKFRYDVVRGRGQNLAFETTRDDRMSAVDAGEALHRLHKVMGVDKENEDVLYAWDCALWFCHTVNSGSVLVPGRSKFSVPGVTKMFDYKDVRDIMGVDMRRFFRAYADDVVVVNKRVLRDYDPYDPVKAEQWGWLMEVAHDRGLSRFPYLAHDSADACLSLNATERQALRLSKGIVIGGTPNSADRMKPTNVISSMDKYDSSVQEHL